MLRELKLGEVTWSEYREAFLYAVDHACGWLAGVEVNEAAAEIYRPGYHIRFIDRSGAVRHRLQDVNGFLFLEALLLRALGREVPPSLDHHLQEFGRGPVFGYWKPHHIKAGRPFFKNRRPIKIAADVDDTAWAMKYYQIFARAPSLSPFLSRDSMPQRFDDLAQAAQVRRETILRTWDNPDWHKWDCDVVCIANMISSISPQATGLERDVFEHNARLLDEAVRTGYVHLMRYYEPKVFGTFLILFYDREYRPFLSDSARDVLRTDLARHIKALRTQPLLSRWDGDDALVYLHGYNLCWCCEDLPRFCAEYADRNLLTP
ncbi:MAG: hypothetical protein U1A78_09875 [Polyangia bacterium]